jgi:hypothetical protein
MEPTLQLVMENLIAAIQELQLCQHVAMANTMATGTDQKEMATISASQEEMRAAISTVRSTRANFELTFFKWI